VIERKNGIRCMSTILDIEFSSWAEQETRSRRGFNEFSQYIECGPQEKYLKYGLRIDCKSILDSRLVSYTWTEVQFLASAL
jgi:hypothetical protein